MITIKDLFREPVYEEYNKCMVYPGGKRIPAEEYCAIQQYYRKLGDERDKQGRLEAELKAHQANVYLEEMATCQSHSVAISRANKRLKGKC